MLAINVRSCYNKGVKYKLTNMNTQVFSTAIYYPAICDFIEIRGAKMQFLDGSQTLFLLCVHPTSGDEYLLRPWQVEMYFKTCAVPF